MNTVGTATLSAVAYTVCTYICLYMYNAVLYIYLFTPWSRVLEKLIGSELVKKFLAFYGTRRFITTFTSARHLSVS